MFDLNNCFFIPGSNDQILDLFPQLIDILKILLKNLQGVIGERLWQRLSVYWVLVVNEKLKRF